jgi:glycosyltransferase involved in cell wall biosynthesis
MKVLQMAYRLPFPPKDGGALGLLRILEGYLETGNEVHLFCIRTPKHWISDEEIQSYLSHYSRVTCTVVDVNTRPTVWGAIKSLFSSSSYHALRLNDLGLMKSMTQVLTNSQFDVIHLDGPFWLPYLEQIRRLSKARLVFRAHNVEHFIWKRLAQEAKNPLKKWYLNGQWPKIAKEESEMAQKVDWILPISTVDATWFKLCSSTPQHLLEAGIPLQHYQLLNFSSSEKWCFLASLEWMPKVQGLEFFLENIWPALIHAHPSLTLSVAGRRKPEHWKNRNIPGVKFVGEVESVKEYFSKHGFLIVPLWSGSGVRIKLIEALAMGMPCISTTVGAEGLGLVHQQHLLEANRVEEWLQVAKDVLSKPEISISLSQKGREFVLQHFDNRVIFEKWMQALDTVH